MNKKSVILFSLAAALFVLFAAFTLAVSLVDIATFAYASGDTAEIGFASLNKSAFQAIGENAFWYDLTELLGVIALGTAAVFALVGLYQLLKRKQLFAVDREILLLAVLYVLVGIFYVFFEVVAVNYRPILVEGVLEASYPSSHSMLACCIFASAPFAARRLVKALPLRITVTLICAILAALTVVGRLLSGVHWLTDIVGAMLLSAALVILYAAMLSFFDEKTKMKK